jgi:Rad3-related DNA helicase
MQSNWESSSERITLDKGLLSNIPSACRQGRSGEERDDKFSAGGAEELYRVTRSLFNITRTVSERARCDDSSQVLELLNERGRLLKLVVDSREKVSHNLSSGEQCKEVNNQLVTLLEAIQKENNSILQTLQDRKQAVLDKIVEIENRRRVFVYTQ